MTTPAVQLNDRQRAYLLAIFEVDQAVEAQMRAIPFSPFHDRPKALPRPLSRRRSSQPRATAGGNSDFREQGRRADSRSGPPGNAAGDRSAARELLHQLFVEETSVGMSVSLTDAVVALASAESDVEARERYARTQRELDGFFAWLDTADLDAEDLDRIRTRVDGRVAQLESSSKERAAQELAAAGGGLKRRHVGAGWLEVKHIPRPNGRLSNPTFMTAHQFTDVSSPCTSGD